MPINNLLQALDDAGVSQAELESLIDTVNHFDIARLLHQCKPEDKTRIFHSLKNGGKQRELLYATDSTSRIEIIDSMTETALASFFAEMDEDEATDILKELEAEKREKILSLMGPKDASTIKSLIRHGEETAGSLMIPSYTRVSPEQTAASILMSLKRESAQDIPAYFYIVNEANALLGYFKLRELFNAPAHAKATQFMREETPKVHLADYCDKVANLMDHEKVSMIPVVDDNNVMQGVITFDDVIRAMKIITDQDVFSMVGAPKDAPFAGLSVNKILARIPWLFITFLGGIISASIMNAYSDSLHGFATVIIFVPFIIGLAGNVGIQGATIVVRGLATGDIQADNLKRVLLSEIGIGGLNGIFFGLFCGGIVFAVAEPVLHTTHYLGFAVGLGIVLAVSAAAVIGTMTPVILMRFNVDPAISTGPFVTVANDIIGLTVYLATTAIIFSSL